LSDPRTTAAGVHGEERPIFQFSYRSVPFRVHLRETDTGTTGMLEAMIGVMPFTVDGDSLRRNMLTLIGNMQRTADFGIAVGRDHSINLSVALPVDGTSSADAILAAAIKQLAATKAFLDLALSLQPPHLRRITSGASWKAA
jgi:hypothetical protein